MKKILVCEDEAAIRDFVVINLTRAGYDVVEADCGETALKKYEDNNGDFDTRSIITMVLLNGLEDEAFEKLCEYLNEETDRAARAGRRYRGKEVAPEKPKKKRSPSRASNLLNQ